MLGYVGMRDENANPVVGKGDLHEAYDFVAEDVQLEGEWLMEITARPAINGRGSCRVFANATEYSIE